MNFKIASRLAPALLVVVATTAAAQTTSRSKADPMNASVAVPQVVFRSTLTQYQRHTEQPVGSWKEANETVNRIGGWRAYAREASQSEAPAAPAAPGSPASAPAPAKPAAAPPPAAGGHRGHKSN
ncbi:MAG: hypothetical protein JNN03_12850 [Rubrivivax sp.]|nr:hypothetical protein [Rubrivivax sp.]